MRIFYMQKEEDAYSLAKALGSETCMKRFLQLARAQGCGTIVQCDNAAHPVFSEEHKEFYAGRFRPVPNKVTELYLFSKRWKKADLAVGNLKNLQENFIGFLALRPFRRQRLVEGFIRHPPEPDSPSKTTFYLCTAEKTFYLLGNHKLPLKVAGFPFMQQDGLFDCCAHVAIHTLNEYLYLLDMTKAASIGAIVRKGAEIPLPKRDYPTEGLTISEMAHIIKSLDLDPLVYEYFQNMPKPPFPPGRVIYHYLESRLPVLIGIFPPEGGHVIVAIGHTFDPNIWLVLAQTNYHGLRPSGGEYHCSTTWVPSFITSDDNFGPYLTVPQWYLDVMATTNRLMIISLLPKGIALKGEDAEVYAHTLLCNTVWKTERAKLPKGSRAAKWSEIFKEHFERKDIVLRTFLRRSVEVRKEFKSYKQPKVVTEKVANLPMPEWVWVTELSLPTLFSQERKLLGQIVLDSTGDARFDEPLYLVAHIPGTLILRDKQDRHEIFTLPKDGPVAHVMRP